MKLLKHAFAIAIVATTFVLAGCGGDRQYSDKELLERGRAGREAAMGGKGTHQPNPNAPQGPRPEGR